MNYLLPILFLSLIFVPTKSDAAGRGVAELVRMQEVFHSVADLIVPSVVHIEAIQDDGKRRNKVSGSGFIWDDEGHVVTNEHVVSQARRVEVRVAGRSAPLSAEVVGTDPQTDLAVLKVDNTEPLPKALLPAADDSARVGDWVLAIGNPYGLDGSVSFGIISARGRRIGRANSLNPFLQTDAMIDFGSSGGPLVNLDGRLVGVNSMGQGRGIGFTIPIATVRQVVDRLLHSGSFVRGWLGIVMQPLDSRLAQWWGLPAGGVIVSQVLPETPAARSGLRPGDIITAVDGVLVAPEEEKDLIDFRRLIADRGHGVTIAVEYKRRQADREWQTAVTAVLLGAAPPVNGALLKTRLGFTVQEVALGRLATMGALGEKGVLVTHIEPGSPASEAEIQTNDLIQRVDDSEIVSIGTLKESLQSRDGKFLLQVWRSGSQMYLLVDPFGLEQDN